MPGVGSRAAPPTLSRRTRLALGFGAVAPGVKTSAVASGLVSGLSLYFLTYFWAFTELQTGFVLLGTFVAAYIGFGLAPRDSRLEY